MSIISQNKTHQQKKHLGRIIQENINKIISISLLFSLSLFIVIFIVHKTEAQQLIFQQTQQIISSQPRKNKFQELVDGYEQQEGMFTLYNDQQTGKNIHGS